MARYDVRLPGRCPRLRAGRRAGASRGDAAAGRPWPGAGDPARPGDPAEPDRAAACPSRCARARCPHVTPTTARSPDGPTPEARGRLYRLRSAADYALPATALANPVCGLLGPALARRLFAPTTASVAGTSSSGRARPARHRPGAAGRLLRRQPRPRLPRGAGAVRRDPAARQPVRWSWAPRSASATPRSTRATAASTPLRRTTATRACGGSRPDETLRWVRGHSLRDDRPVLVPERLRLLQRRLERRRLRLRVLQRLRHRQLPGGGCRSSGCSSWSSATPSCSGWYGDAPADRDRPRHACPACGRCWTGPTCTATTCTSSTTGSTSRRRSSPRSPFAATADPARWPSPRAPHCDPARAVAAASRRDPHLPPAPAPGGPERPASSRRWPGTSAWSAGCPTTPRSSGCPRWRGTPAATWRAAHGEPPSTRSPARQGRAVDLRDDLRGRVRQLAAAGLRRDRGRPDHARAGPVGAAHGAHHRAGAAADRLRLGAGSGP